jgi:hypothetical protein
MPEAPKDLNQEDILISRKIEERVKLAIETVGN